MELLKEGPYADIYLSENKDKIIKIYQPFHDPFYIELTKKACDIAVDLSNKIPEYAPKIFSRRKIANKEVLIMERIDGITIDEYLERKELHSLDNNSKVALSLTNALEAMHSAGYVHNDLNSANILITKDFKVKLIDFDISEDIDTSDNDDVSLSETDYELLRYYIALLSFPFLYKLDNTVDETIEEAKLLNKEDIIEYDTNPKVAESLFELFWSLEPVLIKSSTSNLEGEDFINLHLDEQN